MVHFQTKKSPFGENVQALRLKNIVIFYGHLECFKDIWDIL
jgi:hypothetical protein